MKRSIISVGLTGGIGSGKTTAAKIFEECGAAVIYADLVARDLIDKDKTIRQQIIKVFGTESYLQDGHLDRAGMANRIFNNRKLQKILNDIVHPAAIREINRIIEDKRSEGRYKIVIVEAALIFEAGIEDDFDYVIVVDAGKDVRIDRMMRRDGKSKIDVNARINSQISNREKKTRADFVLQNDGTRKDLENSTRFLYGLLIRNL
jgi:dephospho-CoA kinase